jgi:hypothetical protein
MGPRTVLGWDDDETHVARHRERAAVGWGGFEQIVRIGWIRNGIFMYEMGMFVECSNIILREMKGRLRFKLIVSGGC